MLSIPVLTPAQAAEWDRRTAEAGLSVQALMEVAGRGIAGVLTTRLAAELRRGVLVACGPGNNGGDGWVAARALHGLGYPVSVAVVGDRPSGLHRQAAAMARLAGVREVPPDGPWPAVGLVVDALLGTGASGAPRAPMAGLLARVADLAVPVVAVDGPTGLDLGTGVSHGALPARLTITFGGYRRGHLLARDEVGDLVAIDIGFCPADPSWSTLETREIAARSVGRLGAASHKGTRGRVVIVGGAPGMVGAARLTARSAFGAGAGLVHVVAPPESVAALAAAEPDVQTSEQRFEAPLGTGADTLLGRADAVVIGPGLGRESGRIELIEAVGASTRAPLVLDADALMAFGGSPGRIAELARGRPVVLTPHAGEFRALFPEHASLLGVDPWALAVEAASATGAVVLLKGVPTVVASPDGATITVAAGNPGLATGGSGDTLSGLIGALLGQGMPAAAAAAAAAQALGEAADLAARRTAARSMRPMDVVAALPDVWRTWDRLAGGDHPAPIAPILHELPAPPRA
ncbi:MAG: NAD(P)H-hydrate dehydratase [Gemmatimonadales bacterium]